ncbi:hypothetical protein EON67_07985 [archaeon]|nr:MAG: hypothetical protein EON67_07985 [archaeon]
MQVLFARDVPGLEETKRAMLEVRITRHSPARRAHPHALLVVERCGVRARVFRAGPPRRARHHAGARLC